MTEQKDSLTRNEQISRLVKEANKAEDAAAEASGVGGGKRASQEVIQQKNEAAIRARLTVLSHLTEKDLETIRAGCVRAVAFVRNNPEPYAPQLVQAAEGDGHLDIVDQATKDRLASQVGRTETLRTQYDTTQSEKDKNQLRSCQNNLATTVIGWWNFLENFGAITHD